MPLFPFGSAGSGGILFWSLSGSVVDATWQLGCWMICIADLHVLLFLFRTRKQQKTGVCCWVTWQSPLCTMSPWSFLPFSPNFLWFVSQWQSVTEKKSRGSVRESLGRCQRWMEAALSAQYLWRVLLLVDNQLSLSTPLWCILYVIFSCF